MFKRKSIVVVSDTDPLLLKRNCEVTEKSYPEPIVWSSISSMNFTQLRAQIIVSVWRRRRVPGPVPPPDLAGFRRKAFTIIEKLNRAVGCFDEKSESMVNLATVTPKLCRRKSSFNYINSIGTRSKITNTKVVHPTCCSTESIITLVGVTPDSARTTCLTVLLPPVAKAKSRTS